MSGLANYEIAQSRKVLVAVVDGLAAERAAVASALQSFYRVAAFDDSDRAVSELVHHPPCVILVDETAPPSGGRRLVERLRAQPMLMDVPVIYTTAADRVTLAAEATAMGASSVLVKPYRRSRLVNAISALVNHAVEARWNNLPQQQRDCLRQTVDLFNGISDLIDKGEPLSFDTMSQPCRPLVEIVRDNDYKPLLAGVREHDNYSYVHSLRVATLLTLFGHTIGIGEHDLLVLATGGLMHDVGKMQIGHEVLNKPGRLSPDELAVMQSHVKRSVGFLKACPHLPKGVIIIAAQHHEKLDGSGYPNGVKGGDLNDLARMAAIVDVFGALTDRRCYKPPMPADEALRIMRGEMTSHLDQGLLARFSEMLLDAASNGSMH